MSRLMVEGELDAEILGNLAEAVQVVQGGSKNSLAPRTQNERDAGITQVYYLRDRDFDYSPPNDLTHPVVDREDKKGNTLGWHWCRHEIENYLIDPVLVTAATGWDQTAYEAELLAAARRIRCYQAARWSIGKARRALPPQHDFESKPDNCAKHDFRLPGDLAEAACVQWACDHAGEYLKGVEAVLRPDAVKTSLQARLDQFTDDFMSLSSNVLLWFSGKDLMAAMATWLQTKGAANPGEFRAAMRDWVRAQPIPALNCLPEWKRLCETFKT